MPEEVINIHDAANLLNVSEATVRNWIKSGLLKSKLTNRHVKLVKESIANGDIERLNKRANKTKSTKSFVPDEYSNDNGINSIIRQIIDVSNLYFKSIEEIIYNIALSHIDEKEITEDGTYIINRDSLKQVFDDFSNNLYRQNLRYISDISILVQKLKQSESLDVLGLIYQSLQLEGDKSQKGSYYTPSSIIEELVSDLGDNVKTFMDPCCGTGAFILSAIKKKKIKPQNVYGADLDKTAVFLARINILEFYKDYEKVPNVYHLDSLNQLATEDSDTSFLRGKIDAIATNPPWGASKNASPSEKYAKILESKEVFSMFILKSLELLSVDGELNFLLPESILNIRTHQKIRQTLCSNTSIISVKEFGKAFTGVYTRVISIHVKNRKNPKDNIVNIQTKDKSLKINQDRFLKAKHNVFNIKIDNYSEKLITKIYSVPHKTLKNHAEWALGIVTGDNKRHLKSTNDGSLEPIYKGSDVNYYYLKNPESFINYDRQSLHQVSKDEYYRVKEKLVYKFISNRLVFAYDVQKYLTLNSANILIPNFPDLQIKTVLAFLNSSVFQFLHKMQFSTHKVLKGNLEALPFPIISNKIQDVIINNVNKAIERDKEAVLIIDNMIFDDFGLNADEIEHIKSCIK